MNKNTETILSIVIPCYNEEKNIITFFNELNNIIKETPYLFEIIFVNDGSNDNTLTVLKELKYKYSFIRIINFSRNFGKEAALTAGIDYSKGNAVITIDADLQHPPKLISQFIKSWEEGVDVVVGKRLSRTGEHFLKKKCASLFYKIHNKISDIIVPEDIGDFRLISRRVVESLKLLKENQRFMKGIFAWIGYEMVVVEYYQDKRNDGNSNYSFWKLWNFAIEGITSFSTVPLRIWMYIGSLISIISFILALIQLIKVILYGIDIPGYASIFIMVLFLGGIQLIGIGVIGEYIGRIYFESKRRPIYIVENEY